MIKYLKFLEDVYNDNKLIWKKDGLYKVSYHNLDSYSGESENDSEKYVIDTKAEGKRYIVIEKDED